MNLLLVTVRNILSYGLIKFVTQKKIEKGIFSRQCFKIISQTLTFWNWKHVTKEETVLSRDNKELFVQQRFVSKSFSSKSKERGGAKSKIKTPADFFVLW